MASEPPDALFELPPEELAVMDMDEKDEDDDKTFSQEMVDECCCWMVSCRSARSLDVFSRRTLVYQPVVENICSLGTACKRLNDEVHWYVPGIFFSVCFLSVCAP
jgi:hypothetical protein